MMARARLLGDLYLTRDLMQLRVAHNLPPHRFVGASDAVTEDGKPDDGIRDALTDEALRDAIAVLRFVVEQVKHPWPERSVKRLKRLHQAVIDMQGNPKMRFLSALRGVADAADWPEEEAMPFLRDSIASWGEIDPQLPRIKARQLLRELRNTNEGGEDADQGFFLLAALFACNVEAFGYKDVDKARRNFMKHASRHRDAQDE